MTKLPELSKLIDEAVERNGMPRHPKEGPRRHLGASVIGKECTREIYYSWRWATKVEFEGRILRLFERGHDEEPRFVELLQMIGAEVEEYDPATIDDLWYHPESDCYFVTNLAKPPDDAIWATCNNVTHQADHVRTAAAEGVILQKPKQHRFVGYKGHFGGAMDGIATGVPGLEIFGLSLTSRVLCEFKTHGLKSYDLVEAEAIKRSKAEHFAQMQIYMDEKDLEGGVYFPVCKNDDRLLPEFIPRDRAAAQMARDRAQRIIDARRIPPRMAYASASNFKCKMCEHRRPCHYGTPLEMNCRTCIFSLPVDGGRWLCQKFNALIPEDKEIEGCPAHQQIVE